MFAFFRFKIEFWGYVAFDTCASSTNVKKQIVLTCNNASRFKSRQFLSTRVRKILRSILQTNINILINIAPFNQLQLLPVIQNKPLTKQLAAKRTATNKSNSCCISWSDFKLRSSSIWASSFWNFSSSSLGRGVTNGRRSKHTAVSKSHLLLTDAVVLK